MANRVIIVGAGGLGREISSWITPCLPNQSDWELVGFIADDGVGASASVVGKRPQLPVLGSVDGYELQENDHLVLGIADPTAKKNVATRLKTRGARFLSLIHPWSFVAPTATIGEGVIVYPFGIVHTEAKVGSFVVVNSYSNVGHDSIIGDWSTLSGHVDITGGCRVGESVFFGSNSTVLPGTTVASFSKVGASSCVVRDVKEGSSVFGVPAKNQ